MRLEEDQEAVNLAVVFRERGTTAAETLFVG
jgi:hypothetical protein